MLKDLYKSNSVFFFRNGDISFRILIFITVETLLSNSICNIWEEHTFILVQAHSTKSTLPLQYHQGKTYEALGAQGYISQQIYKQLEEECGNKQD